MLRPRHHRQQSRSAFRAAVQLGGHALARVLSRGHAANDAKQDAALVERGHLGVRGAAGQPDLGRETHASLPRNAVGRRPHAHVRTQRRVSGAAVTRASPVRLLRIVAGRSILGGAGYGYSALIAILHDLGAGAEINRAIEKHTETMAKIETDFEAFAKQNAESLGPGLDWEKPDLKTLLNARHAAEVVDPDLISPRVLSPGIRPRNDDAWDQWAHSHPTNFWVMTRTVGELIEDKEWKQAEPLLKQLIELCPQFTGSDSAYAMLANTYRELGETNAERQVLTEFARRDDEALDAYQRLMELGEEQTDWDCVEENAQRYLAVNPLVALPHRFLAEASEAEGHANIAIEALKAWLTLDPPNPAEVHYRLARLLHETGAPARGVTFSRHWRMLHATAKHCGSCWN